MLEQLAIWFYDPLVFWGLPFILALAWSGIKRLRTRPGQKDIKN